MCSDSSDGFVHFYRSDVRQSARGYVGGDKGPRPADPCRAVNHDGRSFGMSAPRPPVAPGSAPGRLESVEASFLVVLGGGEKVEHGGGGQRNAVVGPRQELEVEDAPT